MPLILDKQIQEGSVILQGNISKVNQWDITPENYIIKLDNLCVQEVLGKIIS